MPEFVDSEPDLLISENTPLLNDNNDLANTVVDSIRESKSSTAETIANILNLLMGMGILSLPFAFFKLGWFLSIGFILMFAIMAFYTGTLISTILSMNENVKSMYEMVDAAFSLRGRMVFGFVFMLELFTASIAMIILFADSIIMLFPELADYKTGLMVGAVLLLTPLTMMDSFKSLAVFSYLGLVSIIFLVLTVVALVLSNLETSIIPPATTSAWPRDFSQVGLGIGLLFVGFDGHSVFPSLNTQMRHSNRFPVSLGVSYLVVFLVYLLVGTLGYTMFGNDVEPEVLYFNSRLHSILLLPSLVHFS